MHDDAVAIKDHFCYVLGKVLYIRLFTQAITFNTVCYFKYEVNIVMSTIVLKPLVIESKSIEALDVNLFRYLYFFQNIIPSCKYAGSNNLECVPREHQMQWRIHNLEEEGDGGRSPFCGRGQEKIEKFLLTDTGCKMMLHSILDLD